MALQTRLRGHVKIEIHHMEEETDMIEGWRALQPHEDGRRRIAVNVRLTEPEAVADLPIDHFDGLNTFKDLPRDGRCVKDYWC